MSRLHLFFPLAIGTLGPVNCDEQDFIGELGHRMSAITEDPQETAFLFQRLSAAAAFQRSLLFELV
jgi:hypothetical protein